ncbi:hypothetical protein ACMFMG_010582 [Clarireedia jacksonii]
MFPVSQIMLTSKFHLADIILHAILHLNIPNHAQLQLQPSLIFSLCSLLVLQHQQSKLGKQYAISSPRLKKKKIKRTGTQSRTLAGPAVQIKARKVFQSG